MANKAQFKILKVGSEAWNTWRKQNPGIKPDLSGASLIGYKLDGVLLNNSDLHEIDLMTANLMRADLSGANLSKAFLYSADLHEADLRNTDFSHADLSETNLNKALLNGASLWKARLIDADLRGADLRNANLTEAELSNADLRDADLRNANLTRAFLTETNLSRAKLNGANLNTAFMKLTFLGDVDLSQVKKLDTVWHSGPSIVSIDTIYRSKGSIPEVFLKGAGVPDSFLDYMRSLVGHPIDYYTCFISYSNKDQDFAERLYADLQNNKVRCWFAPEDMKIGDKIRSRIDESIRIYDKLLLVLSQHSVDSKWVEYEVETAMDKEQEGKPPVLFPIRLDKAVLDSKTGWAAHIRRTRHIGDFEQWKYHDDYQKAFNRLLRDLKAEP